MIEVSNLTKRFGPHVAVDNISFSVKEGEILGFLGPNGAGKTTTMNIMTGYISSNEGSVKINGCDILENPERAKRHIGYLPDVPPIYGDMTVMEYLSFVCDIKKVKKSERDDMIKKIINIVKIDDVKNRLTKNLSKGYRQRVGLAQALVGFPEVIILDEPTNGLDPKQIIEMRDVIKRLGSKHTVILSSHILSEVSAVCDRVLIISKGRIVASDTTENLSESLNRGNKINARIKGGEEEIKEALDGNELFAGYEIYNAPEEGCWDVTINLSPQSDVREELFYTMAEKRLPIVMLRNAALSLEEIFLKVTDGGDLKIAEGEKNASAEDKTELAKAAADSAGVFDINESREDASEAEEAEASAEEENKEVGFDDLFDEEENR